jgi:hypothetical protein
MHKNVIALALKDTQSDLRKFLAAVVKKTSKRMLFTGIYSTSPFRGASYLLSKAKKGRA